jgi:hypothetical protein
MIIYCNIWNKERGPLCVSALMGASILVNVHAISLTKKSRIQHMIRLLHLIIKWWLYRLEPLNTRIKFIPLMSATHFVVVTRIYA